MIKSPGLTGMPAAPIVTQLGSNVMNDPVGLAALGAISPLGHAAPLMGFWTSASVLSAYMIVMMSVRGPLVPSGLVTVGPRLFPGSIAGRTTLHPACAALGPWNVRFNPARTLSLISAVCVTLLLALVESRKSKTAVASAIIVTAIAIMISTSVNPDFFFIPVPQSSLRRTARYS